MNKNNDITTPQNRVSYSHNPNTSGNRLVKNDKAGSEDSMVAKTLKQDYDKNKEFQIIHITPKMDEEERERKKKRIGNDLHDVFSRIKEELKIESE